MKAPSRFGDFSAKSLFGSLIEMTDMLVLSASGCKRHLTWINCVRAWIFQTLIFVLHTCAGVSRWCWLFASSQRYAAVYHPLWHRRQWRLCHRAVPAILVISIIVNAWLLIAVKSEEFYCTEAPLFNKFQVNENLFNRERPLFSAFSESLIIMLWDVYHRNVLIVNV